MKLVIAEKPSVAQEIGRVIGATKKRDGCLEGNGYIVSWCYGHLVELAPCDAYDEKFKKWNLADLPIIPSIFQLRISEGKKKQMDVLKKLMFDSKVDGLIVATDAGREGELIFRHVYNYLKCTKPFTRLWINSYEDEAIRKGFQTLIAGNKLDHLYDCACARQQADWLVGMNATRLYSCKYGSKLTLGRVQTPTLAMIVKRDKEIASFQTTYFYKAHIIQNEIDAESEELSKDEALYIEKQTHGKDAQLVSLEVEEILQYPSHLFDLTSLQRECNRIYGLTAQETLSIAQKLYESKLITYPRTDSTYLSEDNRDSAFELINLFMLRDGQFKGIQFIPEMKRLINNAKVSDHHAIIPTKLACESSKFEQLPTPEQSVLQLIVNRTVSASAKPARYKKAVGNLSCEGHSFVARSTKLIEHGYLEITNRIKVNEDEEATTINEALFNMVPNITIRQVQSSVSEHERKAQAHYNDASLLKEMGRAGSKQMKEIEGIERVGLGTPATRANIIENLIMIGYIMRKGKALIATDKGNNLIQVAPLELIDVNFTVNWEETIAQIKDGKDSIYHFINKVKAYVSQLILEKANIEDSTNPKLFESKKEKEVVGTCPKCKKGDVIEVATARGKNWYCSNYKEDGINCEFKLFEKTKYFDNTLKLTNSKVKKLIVCENVSFTLKTKDNKNYSANFFIEFNGKWTNLKKSN